MRRSCKTRWMDGWMDGWMCACMPSSLHVHVRVHACHRAHMCMSMCTHANSLVHVHVRTRAPHDTPIALWISVSRGCRDALPAAAAVEGDARLNERERHQVCVWVAT
eukprot:356878-Chlamydomonas_euryale.AAC.2